MKNKQEDKILSKCRKLLAMANDCSSENEAATAMRHLQILLAKHNLDMSNVEANTTDVNRTERWHYSGNGAWSRIIANAVARLYFCRITYSSYNQKEGYTFFGEAMNREVALAMASAAIKQLNKEANREAKEYGCGSIDYPFRVSFRNAAAHRVNNRCNELIALAKEGKLEDLDGSTLPVLADVYKKQLAKVDEFIDLLNLKKTPNRTSSTNLAGQLAGDHAGNNVKLKHNQIGQNKKLLA